LGKFGKVVERGDNRKWLKTDPKPNLLTITTGPPPYIIVQTSPKRRAGLSATAGLSCIILLMWQVADEQANNQTSL